MNTNDLNPIVDHNLKQVDLGIRFDSSDWAVGETRAMGLTREQLGQGLGVPGDSSLFNINSIQLHDTGVKGAFGFVLGHSDSLDTPEGINTGQKAVFTDQLTGTAHLFHALHLPGKSNIQAVDVHETAAAMEQNPEMRMRRAARWRVDNSRPELLTTGSVLTGVTKSVAGDSVKYLVTPYGSGPNAKANNEISATHRLLTQNGNNSSFFNGQYSTANRTTVPLNGQEAIVMTGAHFDSIVGPLQQSLELNMHPFEKGLYLHATKLDDADVGKSFTVPLTITRTPLLTESASSFTRLSDLTPASGTSAPVVATASELQSTLHPECGDTKMVLESMEDLSLEAAPEPL